MLILRTLGAIVVLAGLSAMPAQAQQVMSEPAYCAFFYPNANCQNKGPGNPYTDPNYRRDGGVGLRPVVECDRKPHAETNAQGQRGRPHVNHDVKPR